MDTKQDHEGMNTQEEQEEMGMQQKYESMSLRLDQVNMDPEQRKREIMNMRMDPNEKITDTSTRLLYAIGILIFIIVAVLAFAPSCESKDEGLNCLRLEYILPLLIAGILGWIALFLLFIFILKKLSSKIKKSKKKK